MHPMDSKIQRQPKISSEMRNLVQGKPFVQRHHEKPRDVFGGFVGVFFDDPLLLFHQVLGFWGHAAPEHPLLVLVEFEEVGRFAEEIGDTVGLGEVDLAAAVVVEGGSERESPFRDLA